MCTARLHVTNGAGAGAIERVVCQPVAVVVQWGVAVAPRRQHGPLARSKSAVSASARATLANTFITVRPTRDRRSLDAATTFIGNAVTVGVITSYSAGVRRARTYTAGASSPIAEKVALAQHTLLLPCATLAATIQARVLIAGLRASRRASADVIDDVVGLAVAVVVFR
jgi:hypothetical protein